MPGIKSLEHLLDNGVKVALVYGDRDYRCPWMGAEQLSLAANWSGANQFRDAGYQYIRTNESYNGGMVRQHGNLSFSRVFEAGHDAAAYQPETVQKIFNRAMFGRDVATGQQSTSGSFSNYTTTGPSSSLHVKNELPAAPQTLCYLYDVRPFRVTFLKVLVTDHVMQTVSSCSQGQWNAFLAGNATIQNFVVIDPPGTGGPIAVTGFTI
jgi:hypothetical protein